MKYVSHLSGAHIYTSEDGILYYLCHQRGVIGGLSIYLGGTFGDWAALFCPVGGSDAEYFLALYIVKK